ncbi:MAG: YitT family protein [Clostridia bacterium]|nr:YitT family protein [Clostridia bacterium]
MRYLVFIFSLFVLGLGIAVAKRADWGISPVTSFPNVLSLVPATDFLTVGQWLFLWNSLFTFGQILILRKNFQWIQLLQIPLSLTLGWFTDLWVGLLGKLPLESITNPIATYGLKVLLVLFSVFLLALAVCLSVTANVVMNSGEAFVKAIADTWHFKLGNVKTIFDLSCVTIAVVASLLILHHLVGVGIGTVICATCTGFVVKWLMPVIKPLDTLLSLKRSI